MSITGTDSQVVYRPWTGHPEDNLPDAFWIGIGSVEGDVSGGSRIVNIELKPAGNPLVTTIFSLEQLSVTSAELTAGEVRVQTVNMDFLLGQPADAIWSRMILLGATATQTSSIAGDHEMRPALLGQPRSAALAAFLQFSITNTNLISMDVVAQGYRWGGAALLVPGGPRRPPGSIYGT